MGRPEKPIASCDKDLEALARWLRGHRARAGLSYGQLAERTQHLHLPSGVCGRCSPDTLARAASGVDVPKRRVVLAYAGGCDANLAEAERLWKRARYRQSRTQNPEEPAPHISLVRDFAELRAALLDLYRKDGSRPYQELQEVSGGALAHATVGRVIGGQTGRPTRQFVIAFAETCGVRGVALNEWGQAWERAEERRLGGRGPVIRRRRAATQTKPGSDGVDQSFYVDRDRLPDGQEIYRVALADMMKGTFTPAWALSDWDRDLHALTAREVEAAHYIRDLQPPTTKRRHTPRPSRRPSGAATGGTGRKRVGPRRPRSGK